MKEIIDKIGMKKIITNKKVNVDKIKIRAWTKTFSLVKKL